MTIKLLSDLHVEFKVPIEKMEYFAYNGEEVLVLAGDIHCGFEDTISTIKTFHNAGYQHIVYVPGNHEYYGYDIAEFNAKMRRYSEGSTWFHFLDKDWFVNEKTRSIFIGATLWTDFANNPISEMKVVRGITDFRRIPDFSTTQCAEMHRRDITYIKGAITTLHNLFPDYKMYVVTHFLPANVCIAPEYREDQTGLNDYFANKLDDYLFDGVPEGLTWLFGHTHSPCDIQHGNTRLIANPYGYHGYESQRHFRNKCYV